MKIGTIVKYSENYFTKMDYKSESKEEFKELEELDRNSRMMIIHDDGKEIIARDIHLETGMIEFGCYCTGLTKDDLVAIFCTNDELIYSLREEGGKHGN